MLNNISKLGTVLTKDALKAINGGKLNCLVNGQCIIYSSVCGEAICRLDPCPGC